MMLTIIAGSIAIYITIRLVCKFVCRKDSKTTDYHRKGWYGKENKPTDTGNPDNAQNEDTSVRPFKISVPEEVLTDLQKRLENTRFHEPLKDDKFNDGFNPDYLREVVEYWKKQYSWRKQEEDLNKYPHFKTRIEGLDVHFVRIKPTVPEDREMKVIPLLIIHGWPGSIVEFYNIIPLLTTPRTGQDFVFEVICPSIPGYGFSESPHVRGFNSIECARIFIALMERIGHQKFYVQGGDWGSVIATNMSRYSPERVYGLHLNFFTFVISRWETIKLFVISWLPFLVNVQEYKLMFPTKKTAGLPYEESAYFHMQATKPNTVGCAMADTPAGLAAYILEKFSTWTDNGNVRLANGGLKSKYTLDELLTNVMVYWVNNTFTGSARFYKENFAMMNKQMKVHEKIPPVAIPSALAVFPHELRMYPKTLLSRPLKNLVSYNIMPRGGHFAAMEEPQLLADDIWKFVSVVERY